jgi:hypothetical protein
LGVSIFKFEISENNVRKDEKGVEFEWVKLEEKSEFQ